VPNEKKGREDKETMILGEKISNSTRGPRRKKKGENPNGRGESLCYLGNLYAFANGSKGRFGNGILKVNRFDPTRDKRKKGKKLEFRRKHQR